MRFQFAASAYRILTCGTMLALLASASTSFGWQLPQSGESTPGAAVASDGGAPTSPKFTPPKLLPQRSSRPLSSAEAAGQVLVEDSAPNAAGPAGARKPSSGETRVSDKQATTAAAAPPEATVAKVPAKIEGAKLNGILPGKSTLNDVKVAWGAPKTVARVDGLMENTYAFEPFKSLIVAFDAKNVVATIVVHLQEPVSHVSMTKQLGIDDVEPALVRNETGEVLGQVFPERGVLYSFDPGRQEFFVAQIILQPIDFQPFALRAEANLHTKYEASLADLMLAVKLNPKYARGYCLTAQLLAAMNRAEDALVAAEEAVRLEPANAESRLARARALELTGQTGLAATEAKAALETPGISAMLHARALCQLADAVAAPPAHNYHQAVDYRVEAIKLLEPLLADAKAGTQSESRELLLEAHLAVAHDVAWGSWNRKAAVAQKWLNEAEALASERGQADDETRFRLSKASLSAGAALSGELDPATAIRGLHSSASKLLAQTEDPLRKQQIQWEYALALFDGLQINHTRGKAEQALDCGQKAVAQFEALRQQRANQPGQAYILGRLYFRVGAVHAVLMDQHAAAIAWFERATPLLKEPPVGPAAGHSGKQGESLVSMAVSYWETGDQRTAMKLTTDGLQLMEQAVQQGLLTEANLAVPYANLSSMHRHLGDAGAAQKFEQLASGTQPTRR